MKNFRKQFLSLINYIGNRLPKRVQRFVADFPGVIKLFEKMSASSFDETTTPEGFRLVINPLLHSALSEKGIENYEPGIRKVFAQLAQEGMVAYDIGANVGVFSFLFAHHVGERGSVYSFEPERNNYICFERSIECNAVKNIFLHKQAVGNETGQQQFDRRGGAFSGRLINEESQYKSTANIEQVETISIDYLIEQKGYPIPDIIKIDVEGNEGLVLEGASHTLKNHRPIIVCELHSHLGDSCSHVIDMLCEAGYVFKDINNLASESATCTLNPDVTTQHIVAVKK